MPFQIVRHPVLSICYIIIKKKKKNRVHAADRTGVGFDGETMVSATRSNVSPDPHNVGASSVLRVPLKLLRE